MLYSYFTTDRIYIITWRELGGGRQTAYSLSMLPAVDVTLMMSQTHNAIVV